ncbi:MAG: thrombospondin type 3 repeat-containing protein [Myxococcota bacterium]
MHLDPRPPAFLKRAVAIGAVIALAGCGDLQDAESMHAHAEAMPLLTVDVTANTCPSINSVTAVTTDGGRTFTLLADVYDPDPADLVDYLWSADTAGSFDDPASTTPTFTCDEEGRLEIGLIVSDDGFGSCVSPAFPAAADTPCLDPLAVQTSTFRVTEGTVAGVRPTLARDNVGPLVAYGLEDESSAEVRFQRLNEDGSLAGESVAVGDGTTFDVFGDVSGSRIVYVEKASALDNDGDVIVYDIATGSRTVITDAPRNIEGPRISDTDLAWVEVSPAFTTVVATNLGIAPSTFVLGGPAPSAFDANIDSAVVAFRFNDFRQGAVVAYDLSSASLFLLSVTDAPHGRPSISGTRVAWELDATPSPGSSIETTDIASGVFETLVDDGAINRTPSVDGERVSWESDAAGSFNIYLHDSELDQTFQLTDSLSNQSDSDLMDDFVVYGDDAGGGAAIYVTKFALPAADPCAALGGDVDADGVCDVDDNCPNDPNPMQTDADNDSFGDACDPCPADSDNDMDEDLVCGDVDNCPETPNPDQADTDRDGVGNACDRKCSLLPIGELWCPPPQRMECSAGTLRWGASSATLWLLVLALTVLARRVRDRHAY